jgi:hypothetical protein
MSQWQFSKRVQLISKNHLVLKTLTHSLSFFFVLFVLNNTTTITTTMELFLFRHDEWERRYNCSTVVVDAIPADQRRQLINGGITLLLYVLFMVGSYGDSSWVGIQG